VVVQTCFAGSPAHRTTTTPRRTKSDSPFSSIQDTMLIVTTIVVGRWRCRCIHSHYQSEGVTRLGVTTQKGCRLPHHLLSRRRDDLPQYQPQDLDPGPFGQDDKKLLSSAYIAWRSTSLSLASRAGGLEAAVTRPASAHLSTSIQERSSRQV
jgi:hypothetical protein